MREFFENLFIKIIFGFFDTFDEFLTDCYCSIINFPKKLNFTIRKITLKLKIPIKCNIEKSLLGKKRHGIEWYNGTYISKKTNIPQGRWSKADIAFATKMVNTLPKNKGGYFNFPENSTSIVYMPNGEKVRATKFWIKNDGITWYGYPLL